MAVRSKRNWAIQNLYWTLGEMIFCEDWFRRSELATRCISTIYDIGTDSDIYFSMESDYLVTSLENLRKYRFELNKIVDAEEKIKRELQVEEFKDWLHEIKLLLDGE